MYTMNKLQFCLLFVAQYSICFGLSVSVNYPSTPLHTISPDNGKYTVMLTVEMWFWWMCNVQSGAKVTWHWRHHVKHRVSSDFCVTLYNFEYVNVSHYFSAVMWVNFISAIICWCIVIYVFGCWNWLRQSVKDGGISFFKARMSQNSQLCTALELWILLRAFLCRQTFKETGTYRVYI
jgi:hypothetical protein